MMTQNVLLDGLIELEKILANSDYRDIYQAIASLSLFTHPDTCKQLNNQNLFPVIRYSQANPRHSFLEDVMFDDNASPTNAFLWTNSLDKKHFKDVQFNHIYADSSNKMLYTNLCNLVVTPAFLGKLTDKVAQPHLQYRAYELYGFAPQGIPDKPDNYETLKWADTLPPVKDVKGVLRERMKKCRKNKVVLAAKKLGWFFSDFRPDSSL